MNEVATRTALLPPDALNRPEPAWRRESRMVALDWLNANGMPTGKDEAWKYTPVDQVLTALLSAADGSRGVNDDPAADLGPRIDDAEVDRLAGDHGGPRLVFVDGVFDPRTSRPLSSTGIEVGPRGELDRSTAPARTLDLTRFDGLVALNHAAADDAALIELEPRAVATDPIHIVHLSASGQGGAVRHAATEVHMGAGSRATVIETYAGLGAGFTNASTVIDVDDDADLTYQRVQAEPLDAVHVGHTRVRLARAAQFRATSVNLGALVSRVALDVSLVGDGAAVDLHGLYLPAGRQRHDNVTTVEHAASHGHSTQLFKGVIDDRGRGSFTGRVLVDAGTVDNSADQTNRSLLLRSTAQSDTRPWLEILADDVRCEHGAAVGRLDDEALFYLRSRGIPEEAARDILVDAFAVEITDAIEPESLRTYVAALVAIRRGAAKGPVEGASQ